MQWANIELKTGRSIRAIIHSWGASKDDEVIEYFELAKEMGEEKIVKALRKESDFIKTYERGLLAATAKDNVR